jgi:predicted alpha/beta superfamily hydrolase
LLAIGTSDISWPKSRTAAIAFLALFVSACGGGSSGGKDDPSRGSTQYTSIASRNTSTSYPLSIYAPPASAGPRQDLPVIYALDGETWFQTLAGIAESTHTPAIVVAIHTAGQRNRDFVPINSCTSDGGGQAKYLDFIRQELIPYIESKVGGSATQRILFGHSHGGSFVLYALFAEGQATSIFTSYLASDASVSCFRSTADQWEQAYASTHTALPVRLQVSYATQGNYQSNLEYAQAIAKRNYGGLSLFAKAYNGSHGGFVPEALAEGIDFAVSASP